MPPRANDGWLSKKIKIYTYLPVIKDEVQDCSPGTGSSCLQSPGRRKAD